MDGGNAGNRGAGQEGTWRAWGRGRCVSLMKLGCRDRGKKEERERDRKESEAPPNPGYCQLPTQTAQLL